MLIAVLISSMLLEIGFCGVIIVGAQRMIFPTINDEQVSQQKTNPLYLEPVKIKLRAQGTKSRVDFLTPMMSFPQGAYIISDSNIGEIQLVLPDKKQYIDWNIGKMSANLTSALSQFGAGVKVSDVKVDIQILGDEDMIANIPCKRYKMTSSCIVTMKFGEVETQQPIKNEAELWCSKELSAEVNSSLSFFKQVPLTGTGFDELTKATEDKMKDLGLVLKMIMPFRQGQNSSKLVWETEEVSVKNLPSTIFDVPKDYVYSNAGLEIILDKEPSKGMDIGTKPTVSSK